MPSLNLLKWLFLRKMSERHDCKCSQAFIKKVYNLEVRRAKCNIELENIPFPDNSFDDLIFNEVFEHLRLDLIFTMKEVLRVIKPGCVLWLSTPNLRSVEGIYNFIFREQAYSCMGGIYSQYEYLRNGGAMGHVREYTATEVCQFLKRIGFTIREVIYRGEYKRRSQRIITQLMPNLRPFMTIVATKPEKKVD